MTALVFVALFAQAQSSPGPELRGAIAALQRSEFAAAEKQLRAEVAAHPTNAWALSLLGAALDSEHRSADAAPFHRRAVEAAPRVVPILSNYAAHLLRAGQTAEAAGLYERIVALDPANFDANLQLARIAMTQKRGGDALRALDRLPADRQSDPPAALLRVDATTLAGSEASPQDLSRVEPALEGALQRAPADFGILYDLGTAAIRNSHYPRAISVLETALRQQPANADVLYALGIAEYRVRRFESAAQHLSQASKLRPKEPDILRVLAAVTTDLGALDDASATWDRYLQLRPDDDVARRERGYTKVQMGRAEDGLPDLQQFVARHPNDPAGHYELGQAERGSDLAKAAAEFDRALALDANYVPALAARAALRNQQGEPEKAVADLEKAAALRPDDASVLDRLGQTYAALDRSGDALRVLRRAAELAPDDSKTLLHLARALADSGATEESKQVMDRFRRLGPEKKSGVPAGFVEYLAMSEEQRRAAYRARLEKALREHPEDPALQLDEIKLLLAGGRTEDAAARARKLPAASRADAGRAFLAARQYVVAAELLDSGADQTIARALAKGATDDAIAAAPGRPEIYRDAAAIRIAQNRPADAVRILDRAPNDRETLLQRAVAAELAGDSKAADDGLAALRAQSPEWSQVWAAEGMILARRGRHAEARKDLETAIALGASEPGIYYYLALTAADPKTATAAIEQARRLAPADAWVKALVAHTPPPAGDPPYLRQFFR